MCRQLIPPKNNSKHKNGTIRALKLYRELLKNEKTKLQRILRITMLEQDCCYEMEMIS